MNTSIFTESLDLTEAQIDTERRALKNVILIRAGTTLNKRHYSEDVLQKATPLFEGVKAYDSHKIGVARQVSEITGWYSNVHYENGAIRGDRYFSRTRAGQDVFAIAEDIISGRAPRNLAGLSINSLGTGKVQKIGNEEVLYVESIKSASSVDDVTVPAAGGTYLTASMGDDELATQLMQALTFEEYFEARPDYIKRIQNEMKTVRQEDALKAAKADAESNLKALTEAQNELTSLQTIREAVDAELASVRRELALEKALREAKLPALYENDVRQRLMDTPEAKWLEVIDIEKRKAKRVGATALPVVTGAGQQVAQPITVVTAKANPIVTIREALAQVQSPEELQRLLGQ